MTRRAERNVATKPWFLVLAALIVVGTTGGVVRGILAQDIHALLLVANAATAVGWLVVLVVGVIGRRRERREQAEAGDDRDGR
ncbi:hypothetical protein ACI782_12825 [Geodermatophilus sp. SYSU D00703]